ncbi:cytochrome c biogenesis protein CcdA [Massilia phosphatilytica]
MAAPLAGALVYISQTRDVVDRAAAALFAMAIGMSIPLLLDRACRPARCSRVPACGWRPSSVSSAC